MGEWSAAYFGLDLTIVAANQLNGIALDGWIMSKAGQR
jgi:hypothetical protein